MYVVSKYTQTEVAYIVSRWSFTFTKRSLDDVLRRPKKVLRTPLGKPLEEFLKNDRLPLQNNPSRL